MFSPRKLKCMFFVQKARKPCFTPINYMHLAPATFTKEQEKSKKKHTFLFFEHAHLVLRHYLHAFLRIRKKSLFSWESLKSMFSVATKVWTSVYCHYLHAFLSSDLEMKTTKVSEKTDFFLFREDAHLVLARFASVFPCISPHSVCVVIYNTYWQSMHSVQ